MTKARFPSIPFALSLVLLASAASGAQAQGSAVLFGRQDFEMEWKVEPIKAILSVRYLAAKRQLRLEPLDGSARAMVRDLATGEAVLLVGQGQRGAYKTRAAPMGGFRPDGGGEMRKVGPEECREFTSGPVTLCLTDDGIPLIISFPEGTLTASRLLRQPQLPAFFEVPKGVELKPLPPGMNAPLLPF
jgi:hypothetical protein